MVLAADIAAADASLHSYNCCFLSVALAYGATICVAKHLHPKSTSNDFVKGAHDNTRSEAVESHKW